jgi:hypothetical protein
LDRVNGLFLSSAERDLWILRGTAGGDSSFGGFPTLRRGVHSTLRRLRGGSVMPYAGFPRIHSSGGYYGFHIYTSIEKQ